MVAVKKLAMYLIPLVVLVILVMAYYSDEGMFGKLKSGTDDVEKYLPNIDFGAEEVEAIKPTIPKAHQKAVDSLVSTMKEMRDSKNKNCFANYGSLPDLGEQGTSLRFTSDSDKVLLTITGGAGGIQEVGIEEIEGIKLCVIAGTKIVADNFVESFINDKEWDEKKKGIKENHFQEVSEIRIYNLARLSSKISGVTYNVIKVPEFGTKAVNDIDNFEDGGYLYTPDNKHICFFPTSYFSNDEDGLNDDIFKITQGGNSIPQLLYLKKLKLCKEEVAIEPVLDENGLQDGALPLPE